MAKKYIDDFVTKLYLVFLTSNILKFSTSFPILSTSPGLNSEGSSTSHFTADSTFPEPWAASPTRHEVSGISNYCTPKLKLLPTAPILRKSQSPRETPNKILQRGLASVRCVYRKYIRKHVTLLKTRMRATFDP